MKVDINCDLGEGSTASDCIADAQLMPYISRCNIACGGHAGNLETMKASLENAKKNHLQVGAHPGYPDPENFGRNSMKISFNQLESSLIDQISQLEKIASKISVSLSHIKCHGALYNDAESSPELANRLVKSFNTHFPGLSIIGLANGEMEKAAQHLDCEFLREGFMDRAYLDSGYLVSRKAPNSVYHSLELIVKQALQLAQNQPLQTYQNNSLRIPVDTICLHGDTPNAKTVAKQVFESLTAQGIDVA
ncbi:5-oxoprolinase subunit PxpA [Aliikangiella marina]|uniref:5-oxoprolinase subunit PxpA n=1 Tax=Aliikangiella marina TaxID=1712262 RepID=A0A545T6Q3_9GAMM|nr:5-oxoprolinase subunit PxpA [Aliikangiella marina]TQV72852.1 5-oxoprolinase subunit PxpA [Aliikangiella marina]